MILRSIPIFIIAAGMLAAMPAAADPPWQSDSDYGYHQDRESHKHKYKHKRKHDREYGEDDDYDGGYRDRGGPPPWAPAHGYRRKHDGHRDTVVIVNPPPEEERVYYDDRQAAAVDFRTTSDQIGISSGQCNRKVVGTIIGGIVGGVVGKNLAGHKDKQLGTVAGVLIGAIVGNQIGRNMDNADANCTNQALERAPDGQAVRWDNPNTGYQYAVTPQKTYQRDDGRYCRDYTTVVKSSNTNQYRQTACRSDQGVWEKQ